MKKIITIFLLIAIGFTSISAESKSELNENSSAIRTDRLSGGKFKDDIEVVSKSFTDEVAVKLYIKTTGDWEAVQDVTLRNFDEQIKIKSKDFPSKMKPKDISEIAIESLNGEVYVAKGSIVNDNVILEIRDEGTDLKKPVVPQFDNEAAYFFDARTAAEKFDENLKIKNQTKLKKISFKVSVYDKKTKSWIYYGEAEVNGKNDVTKVKTKLDLGDYRYFAVEAMDGQDYNYMPIPDDDDLIINVSLN